MNIGWPEGIYFGLLVFGLIVGASVDGDPQSGTHKFSHTLCNAILSFGLLYWGGFFA